MNHLSKLQQQLIVAKYVSKWTCISIPIGGCVGSACALFLGLLDWATRTRWNNPELLYFLPLGGFAVGLIYYSFGRLAERGSDLIMDEIHEPGEGVPVRMAPLILFSTVATHLFGGSAGREGTAIQMGGSIAYSAGRSLKLSESDKRTLLMMGVAAGFGGVFGTPVAGAVFALEVIAIGRISHEAIVPCLASSIIADWSCGAWGQRHTDYHHVIETLPGVDWPLLAKVAVAGICFGLTSVLFSELSHRTKHWFAAIRFAPLRLAIGGALVILLVQLLGTRDYLGLGVSLPPGQEEGVCLLSSFKAGGAELFSWWWKIVFTVVTLSSGFKGGEVTPLFFIGATLGNTLGVLLGAPVDLMAALGFVAVFAGATNTPIACTLMGIELFGAENALYISAACVMAYAFSGHTGIYRSQRIGTPKADLELAGYGASMHQAGDKPQSRA